MSECDFFELARRGATRKNGMRVCVVPNRHEAAVDHLGDLFPSEWAVDLGCLLEIQLLAQFHFQGMHELIESIRCEALEVREKMVRRELPARILTQVQMERLVAREKVELSTWSAVQRPLDAIEP